MEIELNIAVNYRFREYFLERLISSIPYAIAYWGTIDTEEKWYQFYAKNYDKQSDVIENILDNPKYFDNENGCVEIILNQQLSHTSIQKRYYLNKINFEYGLRKASESRIILTDFDPYDDSAHDFEGYDYFNYIADAVVQFAIFGEIKYEEIRVPNPEENDDVNLVLDEDEIRYANLIRRNKNLY